jgi:hypothetical protein
MRWPFAREPSPPTNSEPSSKDEDRGKDRHHDRDLASRAGLLSGVITGIASVAAAIVVSVVSYNAAVEAADTAYSREVGTTAFSDYLEVLIDAETVQAHAVSSIQKGTTAAEREQLIDDLDETLAEIKEKKIEVDLVLTGTTGDLAVLSIDLYGKNAGDLATLLTDADSDAGDSESVSDYIGDKGRLTCAINAGRTTFTEAAQVTLKLRKVPPEIESSCYQDWMSPHTRVLDHPEWDAGGFE